MSELETNIKRINDKLQHLLKQHQQLQKDSERQTKLIAELQQAKQKDTETITALEQKVMVLKAAALQMSEADKKEFEKTINLHLREIDKCIAMLSE